MHHHKFIMIKVQKSKRSIISRSHVFSTDRPNLKHPSDVQSLHNHFLDAFAQEVAKNHPSNSGRILIDVFRILPQLRYLNTLSQQTFESKKSSTPSLAASPSASSSSSSVNAAANTPGGGGAEAGGGGVGGASTSARGLNAVPPASPAGSESSGLGLPTHSSGTAGAT